MSMEKKPGSGGFILGVDKTGWGAEDMPNPKGVALIQGIPSRDLLKKLDMDFVIPALEKQIGTW